MKQARRKELKTNDLSQYLQQIYENVQKNSTAILGGLFAVVVILAVILLVQRWRHSNMEEAWKTYFELQTKDPVAEPEALERARGLAQKEADNPDLGPLAMQLEGDFAYSIASTLTNPAELQRRIDLLQQARRSYEQMASRYQGRPLVTNRANMSLAAANESLIVVGRNTLSPSQIDVLKDQAKASYRAVLENRPNAFADLAESQLSDFESRLEPLKVVATQPATSPAMAVTTAPASASPVLGTLNIPLKPAATQPAAESAPAK